MNQVQATYVAREACMQLYLAKVTRLLSYFKEWEAKQISRRKNGESNVVDNLGFAADITEFETNSIIHLLHSSIDQTQDEVNTKNLVWDWCNEFINYLKNQNVPKDKSLG